MIEKGETWILGNHNLRILELPNAIKLLFFGGSPVGTFILKRILWSILVLFLVSILVFVLMQFLPGDPVRTSLGTDVDQEVVNEWREKFHLNDPVIKQYFLWVKGMLKGDFGTSIMYRQSITDLINLKMPTTITLGLVGILISTILAVILGVITAVKRGSITDQIVTVFASIGLGVPTFWIAIMFILLFAIKLGWFPVQGYVAPWTDFSEFLRYSAMPVATMVITMVPGICRQTRSNMLEVINQDYIRTARANGINERRITYNYALKNALIPVITIIGLQLRIVVGGSVVIERVFNINGVGNLLMNGITNRDYFLVQACVMIISIVTVISNLLVDIAYGLVDPRVRKSWS